MSRIKLNDLPQDALISKEEMKKVFGGMTKAFLPESNFANVQSGLTMPWVSISEDKCECSDVDNQRVSINGIRTNVIIQR